MKVKRLGDHAIVAEFGETLSKGTHLKVMSYYHHFSEHVTMGIVDVIPAYNSITLVYDPARISFQEVNDLLTNIHPTDRQTARFIAHIPVCYEWSMDQKSFCSTSGLRWEEIVKIHLEAEYLIYMMGFLPGFLYMGDVDTRIQLPRKSEPRKKVAKGSVGIADSQTGIYSMESPGGWNIIGRSPVSLFNPTSGSVFPVEVGDSVKFHRINKAEFDVIVNDRNYQIERVDAGK